LWVNRAVGIIDGPDWRIIEEYISGEREDELPCVPVVSEIPFGYKCASTMRLDCDESIKSAEQLIKLYFDNKRPISLAISTDVLNRENSGDVVKRVYNNGGGILSHSHSHPARWGSNYERAFFEASHSANLINNILGVPVVHMVAPFHHAPAFALKAMEDAGYLACIGGSATLDPEFVFARSGIPHGLDVLIGHNQQCMLHGDIFSFNGDNIAFFEEAFDLASASGSWFGYFDHPISERYSYGWPSEREQLQIHKRIFEFFEAQDDLIFTDENTAIQFLRSKSSVVLVDDQTDVWLDVAPPSPLKVCYRFKGSVYEVNGNLN
jgi:hypothetical protein